MCLFVIVFTCTGTLYSTWSRHRTITITIACYGRSGIFVDRHSTKTIKNTNADEKKENKTHVTRKLGNRRDVQRANNVVVCVSPSVRLHAVSRRFIRILCWVVVRQSFYHAIVSVKSRGVVGNAGRYDISVGTVCIVYAYMQWLFLKKMFGVHNFTN